MAQLALNKKARHDYEILETLEAGLVLTGQEVKAARNGQMRLVGSFVTFSRGNANLLNSHISKYEEAGPLPDYEPERTRRVLLHKKEIRYLQEKSHEEGLTIIPLSVYTRKRLIKIEIGVARGKKNYDKRESIKKRDVARQARRGIIE